jgi:hypothetical protein
MNTRSNRRKSVNPIHVGPVFWLMLVGLLVATVLLFFVSIKHQQYVLGQKVREVEHGLREVRAYNQVLLAKISSLSSRPALQRRLEQSRVAMAPIPDTAIARLTPPGVAGRDGVLRTAANHSVTP